MMYDKSKSGFAIPFNFILPQYSSFEYWLEYIDWSPKDPERLYDLLYLKYSAATTRYTSPVQFMLALKRNLYLYWDSITVQMEMIEKLRDIELEEIMINMRSITNQVHNPNQETVDADRVPIPFTSNAQDTYHEIGNKIDGIERKYSTLFKDPLNNLYRKTDRLFRVILLEKEYYYGGN